MPAISFDHSLETTKLPKSRVELHIHLEGSVRPKTILELAKKKNFQLTPNNTINELLNELTILSPTDLAFFLAKIDMYLSLLVGDLNAIERIAYELCEDQSADQVLYFEARYSPHLLSNTAKHYSNLNPLPLDDPNAVTPRDVVLAVNRGFEKACSRFDIQASSILCIITGMPGWGSEVVDLANELKSVANVVGIDIAGNEGAFSEEDEHAFQRAKELGIHRTVHAGEMGPAVNVKNAVQKLHAERIGHGYHVINDKNIYDMCKARRIHFEACPYSSYLSGSVKKSQKHPILTFAEDDVNFSINKDDATVTQSTLSDEYRLLCSHGLNEVHLTRANFNAARSSFLPETKKIKLLDRLYQTFQLQ